MIDISQLEAALTDLSAEDVSGFRQLQFPCAVDNPLAWLAAQHDSIRGYWENRDNQQVAFVGAVLQAHSLDELSRIQRQYPSAALYGGLAFDRNAPQWSGFGSCRFVLPRLELRHEKQGYQLLVNLCFDGRNRLDELKATRDSVRCLRPERMRQWFSPGFSMPVECPDRLQWHNSIRAINDPEFAAHTPKVVLARASTREARDAFDSIRLLQRWRELEPDNYAFYFSFEPGQAFLGVPPERLYHRRGQDLVSEALAGTCAVGATAQDTLKLGEALLKDKKNAYENQLVADAIYSYLEPLSDSVEVAEPRIRAQQNVQHICQPVHADLKPGADDSDLLKALHPTPAVAGLPRENAFAHLAKTETFVRGWYAGALGCVSGEEADFTVGIRSARQQDLMLTLYAGAGIVQASDAGMEWRELNQKIATVTRLLDD